MALLRQRLALQRAQHLALLARLDAHLGERRRLLLRHLVRGRSAVGVLVRVSGLRKREARYSLTQEADPPSRPTRSQHPQPPTRKKRSEGAMDVQVDPISLN